MNCVILQFPWHDYAEAKKITCIISILEIYLELFPLFPFLNYENKYRAHNYITTFSS